MAYEAGRLYSIDVKGGRKEYTGKEINLAFRLIEQKKEIAAASDPRLRNLILAIKKQGITKFIPAEKKLETRIETIEPQIISITERDKKQTETARPGTFGKIKEAIKTDFGRLADLKNPQLIPRETINTGTEIIAKPFEKATTTIFPSTKSFIEKRFSFSSPATIITTGLFTPFMMTTGELTQQLASKNLIKLEQKATQPILFKSEITQQGNTKVINTIAGKKDLLILSRDYVQPSGKITTGGQITFQKTSPLSYELSLFGKIGKIKTSNIKAIAESNIFKITPSTQVDKGLLGNILGKISVSPTTKGSAAKVGSLGIKKFRIESNLLGVTRVRELARPTSEVVTRVGVTQKVTSGIYKYVGAIKPKIGRIVRPDIYGKIVEVETPKATSSFISRGLSTALVKPKQTLSFTPTLVTPKQIIKPAKPVSISSNILKQVVPLIPTAQKTKNINIQRAGLFEITREKQKITPTVTQAQPQIVQEATQQTMPTPQVTKQISKGRSSSRTRQPQVQIPRITEIERVIPRQPQINIPRQTSRGARFTPSIPITPIYYTPPIKPIVPFKLSSYSFGISSRILKGGKRVVGRTPSFGYITGLVRTKVSTGAFRYSGVDYRPIKFKLPKTSLKINV